LDENSPLLEKLGKKLWRPPLYRRFDPVAQRRGAGFELELGEAGIEPADGEQAGVGSLFDDLAGVDDEDAVGVHDRGKAMGLRGLR
jgi:hypothetical protein